MSPNTTTRGTQFSTIKPVLFMAFELGEKSWKLGFTTGLGRKPREKNIGSRDRAAVLNEIARAKKKLGLPEDCVVKSLYEAGRDGFWLHRFLVSEGIENIVVDSTAIEVNRRRKRAKTDRLDLAKLLLLLARKDAGEMGALHAVRVPNEDEEDRRQLHREIIKTRQELTSVTNRIKGLLANQGLKIDLKANVPKQLDRMRKWDGSGLGRLLKDRLQREWAKASFLSDQLDGLEKERLDILREEKGEALDQVRKLMEIRGIGPKSAWLYNMEFFSWRAFKNGKQVGAAAGLAPTPHQSGELRQERGICKAGNRYIRTMAVEIAWCWLEYQPTSALTLWYYKRFGNGGPVGHKIGIVALARKILVALWRYLETGVLPEGTVLKAQLA
jgi:transposase